MIILVLVIVCNIIQWLNFGYWQFLLDTIFRYIADVNFCEMDFVSYPDCFYCLNFINAVQGSVSYQME